MEEMSECSTGVLEELEGEVGEGFQGVVREGDFKSESGLFGLLELRGEGEVVEGLGEGGGEAGFGLFDGGFFGGWRSGERGQGGAECG
ncbi:hypothetical protein C1H46_025542 [Malus baccata]|uniref:Uncharacterized protein n=1 Tax=Malus baccata TaxID=106549 RepID=A0A540LQT9_MALBA|nr:hypothetical protein C1H46_025542 [Malus baccata]